MPQKKHWQRPKRWGTEGAGHETGKEASSGKEMGGRGGVALDQYLLSGLVHGRKTGNFNEQQNKQFASYDIGFQFWAVVIQTQIGSRWRIVQKSKQ